MSHDPDLRKIGADVPTSNYVGADETLVGPNIVPSKVNAPEATPLLWKGKTR